LYPGLTTFTSALLHLISKGFFRQGRVSKSWHSTQVPGSKDSKDEIQVILAGQQVDYIPLFYSNFRVEMGKP
jgi:hypothetical protein